MHLYSSTMSSQHVHMHTRVYILSQTSWAQEISEKPGLFLLSDPVADHEMQPNNCGLSGSPSLIFMGEYP
jgi:hypothetical protein